MFRLMVVFTITGVISSVVCADGASFRVIPINDVRAVSADGNVVIGSNWKWSETTGLVDLGLLPPWTTLYAQDLSADGSVIVGWGRWDSGSIRAFRWTDAAGIVVLDELPGGGLSIDCSIAWSVSADGSMIFGESDGCIPNPGVCGPIPVRWDEMNHINLFEITEGYYLFGGAAYDASADGSIIAGWGYWPSQIFRFTNLTTPVCIFLAPDMPYLEPEFGKKRPYAISTCADGSVITGWGNIESQHQAFRWTQSQGVVGLGDLEGGSFYSEALDLSADGSIVVGFGTSELGSEAFIWEANQGMNKLKDVLQNTYGLDLNGWKLTKATGISADGRIIVGNGIDPNGDSQGWLVKRGEPSFRTLTISIEPNNAGINTVVPSVGQHTYYRGWPVVLNAGVYKNCPDVYSFSHWIGNVNDPNSARITVVMTEDKSVTAVFSQGRRCGDECHPILQGDLNRDCRVNFEDFAVYCAQWLSCTHPDCD